MKKKSQLVCISCYHVLRTGAHHIPTEINVDMSKVIPEPTTRFGLIILTVFLPTD